MNISIFIFCYNEQGSIASVINNCISTLHRGFSSYELIVVDDGSTDGTTQIIEQLCILHPHIISIRHPSNKGIGMALKAGYAACTKEYICAIPGDGQFDVAELLQIKPFGQQLFYSFYRSDKSYSAYRLFLNLSNRVFNKLFLDVNLKDVNWIKVYRYDQIKFVDITLNSSIVESEICAKLIKAGSQPIELKSVYHKREFGVTKGGSWRTVKKAIQEMFALVAVLAKFNKKLG